MRALVLSTVEEEGHTSPDHASPEHCEGGGACEPGDLGSCWLS